jgi:O-methyltransferase
MSGDPTVGQMATYAIHAALELDLLTELDQHPRGAPALAADMGVDTTSLSRLLRALWSLGVLSEEDGVFRLGPMAAFSYDGSVGDPDPAYPLAPAWIALATAVRTGQAAFEAVYGVPFFDYLDTHPELGAHFLTRMGKRGERRDALVADAYDFSRFRRLVDVGGGTGSLLAGILHRYPSAHGLLFDQPSVVAAARDVLDELLLPRIELVGGDMFTSVPADGDAYLLSSILHDWDDDQALRLLKVIRAAMAPSASLLIVEMVLPEDSREVAMKLLDLEMMVLTGGKERTGREYSALLGEAGLELEATIATDSLYTVLVARPADAAFSTP